MIKQSHIKNAAEIINPIFTNTPQYQSIPLSNLLGCSVICKIETCNPIYCFKGRGADFWMKRHKDIKKIVCVSAGNFGQAMAYAGKENNVEVHVFSIETANPIKMDAIKNLGANVHLIGDNYDYVRIKAKEFAEKNNCYFIVDGKEVEITIGAGTIGMELDRYNKPIDAIYIPVGDGALINGIGAWFKEKNLATKIIGICSEGAPSMFQSWKENRIVSTNIVNTIADGIGINTPILEAYELLKHTTDEMLLVNDDRIIEAMRLLYSHEHLTVEPAGAVALAAAMNESHKNQGKTIAIIITGANINPKYSGQWLHHSSF